MALNFPSGTTAFIRATNLITALPFTVGFWAQPNPGGQGNPWSISAGGGTDGLAIHSANGLGSWDFTATDNVGTIDTTSIGTPIAGAWSYILLRALDSTNRQCAVLNPDGSVSTGLTGVNNAVDLSVIFNHDIGDDSVTAFFDNGALAEFFYTLTDIQPGGGTTQDALIRQLAYGGPFSVPRIGAEVVQYRSFRESPYDNSNEPDERFDAPIASGVTWALSVGGAPTIGPHPPLPYWYKRPTEDIASIAMI